jgi:methylenetetrahydrofolate reductase (NADPH)
MASVPRSGASAAHGADSPGAEVSGPDSPGAEASSSAPEHAGADTHAEARTLSELLHRSRFEVLPLDGIEDEVLAHLPKDTKVTVTASPSRGLEATLDLSERLARAGYPVVPHLSARLVRDSEHLEEVLARLQEAGVRELFVPAGDATEPGQYHGAADLLAAMGDARTRFERIGITGYPESHHLISDEETIRAMFAKAEMATDIISQLCLDPATIGWWIGAVRARGTRLPIWIGMPGRVDHAKLVRVSMKIGMGESARFLRHNRNLLARMMTRKFKPSRLLEGLAQVVTDPDANVGGFHLYTFNEVARTERWRRQTLQRWEARP